MNKKMRILLLTLIVSFSMVGAGYAAWGTKIKDTTTLQTGRWQVVLENDASNSLYADDQVNTFTRSGNTYTEIDGVKDHKIYDLPDATYLGGAKKVNSTNYVYTMDPTINSGKNEVKFGFYNLHPGTKAISRFEIRNMGSIPAKIGSVEVLGISDLGLTQAQKELRDAIQVNCNFYKHTGSGDGTAPSDPTTPVLLGNYTGSLSGLAASVTNMLKNKVLEPQAIISTHPDISSPVGSELEVNELTFSIPASSLGDEGDTANLGMDAKLELTFKFNFVQYNNVN
jgi:hypothetical protein